MEITWNELLTFEDVKRIEIFKKIFDENREFKKYQAMLKQAYQERASEILKSDPVINNSVKLEGVNH